LSSSPASRCISSVSEVENPNEGLKQRPGDDVYRSSRRLRSRKPERGIETSRKPAPRISSTGLRSRKPERGIETACPPMGAACRRVSEVENPNEGLKPVSIFLSQKGQRTVSEVENPNEGLKQDRTSREAQEDRRGLRSRKPERGIETASTTSRCRVDSVSEVENPNEGLKQAERTSLPKREESLRSRKPERGIETWLYHAFRFRAELSQK